VLCPQITKSVLPFLKGQSLFPPFSKGGLGGIISPLVLNPPRSPFSKAEHYPQLLLDTGGNDTIAVLYRRKRTGDTLCCHCEPALSSTLPSALRRSGSKRGSDRRERVPEGYESKGRRGNLIFSSLTTRLLRRLYEACA
jgi:hypothetical protein